MLIKGIILISLNSKQALGVGDGQGGLACCCAWGHKELDMTEQLNCSEMKTGGPEDFGHC